MEFKIILLIEQKKSNLYFTQWWIVMKICKPNNLFLLYIVFG